MLLLTIMHPQTRKRPTAGWNSHKSPLNATPKGNWSCTHPCLTQYAINPAMLKDVGIGVPSKYFDFPEASCGRCVAVTLKRARRVRPQRTKTVRNNVSNCVRKPSENAQTAGATPNEIWQVSYEHTLNTSYEFQLTKSARESNSCPSMLDFCLHLATLPSMKSKNRPSGMSVNAR